MDETCASAFTTAKLAVKTMQALSVIDHQGPVSWMFMSLKTVMAVVSGSILNKLSNLLDTGHNSGKGERYNTL